MARVLYPSHSAYSATPQSANRIGRYVHRSIPASSDDQTIVIDPKHNHRPDLLAYELYGSPSYWWVFCSRNIGIIRDPIWDFVAGTEITVPSNKHLKENIG